MEFNRFIPGMKPHSATPSLSDHAGSPIRENGQTRYIRTLGFWAELPIKDFPAVTSDSYIACMFDGLGGLQFRINLMG
jgi:hypothetical protein